MRTKFYLMTVLFLFLVSFPAGARVRLYIQSPPIVSAIPLFWMEEKGCFDEKIDFKVIVSSGHQAGLSRDWDKPFKCKRMGHRLFINLWVQSG
jgi:hypothetical protein